MKRRAFFLNGLALISTGIPTVSFAAGAPYSTPNDKIAFQDTCLRRIEGYSNYTQTQIPEFSSQIQSLEDTYNFPKELILAIVGVEGGTPWLGASRTNSNFQETNGTGWRNGELRDAAGLPQIFDAAYQEAIDNSQGENSLIKDSSISRERMILEERLPNQIPTVAYQSELIPAYLRRLSRWIRPTGNNEENNIVLAQAYNSGVGGIFDNGGRSSTSNLAQRLIDEPTNIAYPNSGVDRRYAQKINDVMQRI